MDLTDSKFDDELRHDDWGRRGRSVVHDPGEYASAKHAVLADKC